MHQRESSSTRKRRITDERKEEVEFEYLKLNLIYKNIKENEAEEWGNGEGAKKFLKEKQPLERKEEEDGNDEDDEENEAADDDDEEEQG
jgi:hypothetical protein